MELCRRDGNDDDSGGGVLVFLRRGGGSDLYRSHGGFLSGSRVGVRARKRVRPLSRVQVMEGRPAPVCLMQRRVFFMAGWPLHVHGHGQLWGHRTLSYFPLYLFACVVAGPYIRIFWMRRVRGPSNAARCLRCRPLGCTSITVSWAGYPYILFSAMIEIERSEDCIKYLSPRIDRGRS